MNFQDFHFHPKVAAGVAAMDYVTPTPIQEQAIPTVLKNQDVLGLAQTGTGKTAAFVLPILNRLVEKRNMGVRALVLAPTRELAEQINDSIKALGHKTRLKSATVYGGVNINPQIQKLKHADIVVACPGRLLDHIGRNTIDLSSLEVLVLDEADMMFDMGFLPDIRRILKHVPRSRQTLLFSATMPKEIRGLANDILHNPTTVQVGTTAPAETVSHALYPVAPHLKTALLLRLLKTTRFESVLVFTRTKHRAKSLGRKLENAGFRSTSLQGNLSQSRRQAAMNGFRDGTFEILVATDIAARGIDVTQVSHVINFDIPSTPDAYIHRIGRTGRATRNGEAFTLVTSEDRDMERAINRTLGAPIERRTVEDFDYTIAAPPKQMNDSRRPREQQAQKQKTARASKRRSGKSGFSWTKKGERKASPRRGLQAA